MKAEDLKNGLIEFEIKYIKELSATDTIKVNEIVTLLGSFAALEKYLEDKKK